METHEIKATLSQIRNMASTMATTPEDQRIMSYRSIDPLFLQIEGHLRTRPDPAASLILDEIKLKVIMMARLEEDVEGPDEFLVEQVDSLLADLSRELGV